MQDDERCCGSGTCVIDAQGRCWCGQQWDGEAMCQPVPGRGPSAPDASQAQDTKTS